LQVVARYAELDVDDDAFPVFANPATSASAAQAWSAGVNWFLNKNIRLNASYSHTTFTGGGGAGTTAPAVTTRQPESVSSRACNWHFNRNENLKITNHETF